MKKTIIRYGIPVVILFILAVFPRGLVPTEAGAVGQQPLAFFSWSNFVQHLEQFKSFIVSGTAIDSTSLWSDLVAKSHESLGILVVATIITLVVGVLKGIYDGFRMSRPTKFSGASTMLQVVLECLPEFFTINVLIVLQFYVGIHFHILIPFQGSTDFWPGTFTPGLFVAILPAMHLARMVRLSVDEQLGQQHIVTARAKGLSPRYITFRHLIPAVFPTIMESWLSTLGVLFSSLVMVEYLFAKSGLIQGIYRAIGETGNMFLYQPASADFSRIAMYYYDSSQVVAYLLAAGVYILIAYIFLRLLLRMFGYRGVRNPYSNSLRDRTIIGGRSVLFVGIAILVVLLLVGSFSGKLFQNPNALDALHTAPDGSLSIPPFQPFTPGHLLGTDILGRDILSNTAHDILPTFGYVGLALIPTVLVALGLALLSAVWKSRFIREVIHVLNTVFTILPGILACLLLLGIPDIYWFGSHRENEYVYWDWRHIALYLGIMALTQLGRSALRFQTTLDEQSQKSYMEAAETTGCSPFQKLRRHYFRPLLGAVTEEMTVIFSRLLLLLSGLGFFYHPLNVKFFATISGWQSLTLSTDFGSLISSDAHEFFSAPWVVFGPALAIFLVVLSLNLVRIGLHTVLTTHVPAPKRSLETKSISNQGMQATSGNL